MAFGIPGSEGTGGGNGNGEFLGRIQYDTRVGFWKTVSRTQGPDGMWTNQESDLFRNPSFLMDLGGLEVGYIKMSSPPVFMLVPYGQPIPPQPQELGDKGRKAFQPGFRVKVISPKTFGDDEPRYFSNSAKTVLGPMQELWDRFAVSPEAHAGKIPVIQVDGTTINEIKSREGVNKYHAPNFKIVGWKDRPESLGERTVPAPTGSATHPQQHTPSGGVQQVAAPSNHVPPPTAKAPSPAEMPDW